MSTKEYRQDYYQRNKEKWVLWAEKNKEKKNANSRASYYNRKDKRKQNNIDWVANNFEKHLFSLSKKRARREGLEHSISLEDIKIPSHCPYFGFEITRIWGQGRVRTNASLDRIDSSKGYIPGNIQVISHLANTMKQDVSIEQLKVFARNVLKVHSDS